MTRRVVLDAARRAALNAGMASQHRLTASHAVERMGRAATTARDLRPIFEDSQWPAMPAAPADDVDVLFAAAQAGDLRRADALAERGMRIVQWRAGDCEGCVRDPRDIGAHRAAQRSAT